MICLDCRHEFETPEQGRYCPCCRSGVIRDAEPEPRNAGVTLTEGTEPCAA